MRKLTFFAVAALAAAASLSSCKKDEESSSVTGAARKSTLVANEWVIAEMRWNNVVMTDSLMDACDKDNVHKFTAAGNYVEVTGASACSGETVGDTLDSGAYTFNADHSKVTITPEGETAQTADVVEFKSNTFTVKQTALGIEMTTRFNKK